MKHLNKHFKLFWGKHILALLLFLMVSKVGVSQTNLYVDANVTSTGNGLSWTTSYKTLREALSIANGGTGKYTIHMAQGTYYPTTNATTIATSRDSSFCIFRKGISILGGYPAGGGTRNSKQYVTKISGDIGVTGSNSDNAHHVLTIIIQTNTTDSLTIDGVNIEGGNANGSGTYIYNGVALLRNTGGGIYINNTGSSTINNVYITNSLIQNSSASLDGGGIENYNCTLIILGSFIANNNCVNYGAGLNNEAGGSLILANTCFVNNVNSTGFGGGLRVSGSSTNDVINCTFTKNSAPSGGAIRVASFGTATVRIYNSIFRSNKSSALDSTSAEADVSNGSILSIYSSNLQSTQTCTSCLTPNTNPLLVDINNPLGNDGFFGTADDGLKLTNTSPCRDVGNNTYIVGYPIDITGAPRVQNTTIDLGSYEFGALMSIVTSGAFSKMNTCTGIASAPNSFLVSGTALNSNVVVTPPTGFEVSTNATTGYAPSLTLNISAQTLVATTVYVRVTSSATGLLSGNITISSTGAPSQLLAINGESTSCTVIAGDTSLKSVAPGFSYVVDASLTISSVTTIPGANVTIIAGKQNGDSLTYTGTLPSGVTVSYSATTGVLTFTGNANAVQYQALLRTVTFKSAPSSSNTTRNVSFTLGNSIPFNGHFYEYVASSSSTWVSSKIAAQSRTLFGLQGYLTTITSANENAFITAKLLSDAWIGCSDAYQYIDSVVGLTAYVNQAASEGSWYWVTGPEAGTLFSLGNNTPVVQVGKYMNWSMGEPNNSSSNENYGEMYASSGIGIWNDLSGAAAGNVGGYICEYGGMAGDPIVILSYARNITTVQPTFASVTTASASLITANSAILGGNVTNNGGATVTERGVVYATTSNPTTANTKVAIGSGIGTFSQNVTGLTALTTYHVRAYAINSAGTSYGADSTFTTLAAASVANISTSSPSLVTSSSATLGGNVINDGGATVTERGVVYSTTINPTTANTKVAIGSGIGTFSQNITGLTGSTTYHVRAYAINSAGTNYGADSTFTTLVVVVLPSVVTSSPTLVGTTFATLGGNVLSNGGANVTENGVVFSTSANPTTSNNKVVIGSGNGLFSQIVAGLTSSTTYHVRAYAKNSVGTSYGADSVFTTLVAPSISEKPNNTFTPNGDGINDYWDLSNLGDLSGHDVIVYNIFGQEVFNQSGYSIPWDGKKDGNVLPTAEYYFLIKGSRVNKSGALLLISK